MVRLLSQHALSFSLAAILCCTVGCGSSVETAESTVTGTVTYDGKPLPAGTVMFYKGPESGGIGTIKPDGTFTLSRSANAGGVQPGEYEVAISSWEQEPNGVNDDGEIVAEGISRIPESYTETTTSNLTATVEPGENTFTFDLAKRDSE